MFPVSLLEKITLVIPAKHYRKIDIPVFAWIAKFLKNKILNENFAKLDTLRKELYILGDFNLDLYQNQNHGGCKNMLVSATVFNDVKNYLQFV